MPTVGYTVDREGKPVKEQQMIVKFSTFRALTEVYRNRKKNNDQGDKGKVRFYIDQTKRRSELRKMAVEHVKGKPDVDFVFADITATYAFALVMVGMGFLNSKMN